MSNRTSTRGVLMGVAAIVLGAGWFFLSPLFIDRVVDEDLDFSVAPDTSAVPTRAQVDAMTDADREQAMARLRAQAAAGPDSAMNESMESAPAQVIGRGQFRDVDAVHRGEGDAIVYRLAEGAHVVRFENFRVANGPALVVYLAEHPAPANADDVLSGFYDLGELKGNVGNQNYRIPADIDISAYKSVVIWCKLFDVLFSPAALQQG